MTNSTYCVTVYYIKIGCLYLWRRGFDFVLLTCSSRDWILKGLLFLFFYESNTFLKSWFYKKNHIFLDNFKSNACLNCICWRNTCKTIRLVFRVFECCGGPVSLFVVLLHFLKKTIILELPCNRRAFNDAVSKEMC